MEPGREDFEVVFEKVHLLPHPRTCRHELVGPVEWDVYDSQFPTAYNCPVYNDGPGVPVPGLETFIKQQLHPVLGVGPFR